VKDGLTYKEAFDGREAVDKIAYIIKTTDRNLALLLGRALDAQKYFHDVTYDHRLRDSQNELYQFRTSLGPYVSGELGGTDGLQSGDEVGLSAVFTTSWVKLMMHLSRCQLRILPCRRYKNPRRYPCLLECSPSSPIVIHRHVRGISCVTALPVRGGWSSRPG
jgi:hypothetical protein